MTIYGKWRVYFNRHGAAPLMWCVSPVAGGWELAIASIGINVHAMTVYRPKPIADEDDGKPSAWIEAQGQLTILESGHASIGSPDCEGSGAQKVRDMLSPGRCP